MKPQDRTRAILRSRLEPSARLLLIAISDHMNEGGVCWVRPETMAEETGLSHSTVDRLLTELQEAGVLRRWWGEHRAKDLSIVWETLPNATSKATKRGGKRPPKVGEKSPIIGDQSPNTGEPPDYRVDSPRSSGSCPPNIGETPPDVRPRSDQEAAIEATSEALNEEPPPGGGLPPWGDDPAVTPPGSRPWHVDSEDETLNADPTTIVGEGATEGSSRASQLDTRSPSRSPAPSSPGGVGVEAGRPPLAAPAPTWSSPPDAARSGTGDGPEAPASRALAGAAGAAPLPPEDSWTPAPAFPTASPSTSATRAEPPSTATTPGWSPTGAPPAVPSSSSPGPAPLAVHRPSPPSTSARPGADPLLFATLHPPEVPHVPDPDPRPAGPVVAPARARRAQPGDGGGGAALPATARGGGGGEAGPGADADEVAESKRRHEAFRRRVSDCFGDAYKAILSARHPEIEDPRYPWIFHGKESDRARVTAWIDAARIRESDPEPGLARLSRAARAYIVAAFDGRVWPHGEKPTTRRFTATIAEWLQPEAAAPKNGHRRGALISDAFADDEDGPARIIIDAGDWQ